jgi:hypothetical protein
VTLAGHKRRHRRGDAPGTLIYPMYSSVIPTVGGEAVSQKWEDVPPLAYIYYMNTGISAFVTSQWRPTSTTTLCKPLQWHEGNLLKRESAHTHTHFAASPVDEFSNPLSMVDCCNPQANPSSERFNFLTCQASARRTLSKSVANFV